MTLSIPRSPAEEDELGLKADSTKDPTNTLSKMMSFTIISILDYDWESANEFQYY